MDEKGKRKVSIETSDAELYEMLALWLYDDGYEVVTTDDADLCVIDTEEEKSAKIPPEKEKEKKGTSILYVIDDGEGSFETSEDSLARPFTKLEFLGAVRKKCGGEEIPLRLDHKRKRIYSKKSYITLTEKEYLIFRLLYDAAGNNVPRDDIAAIARGGEQKTNAADVYICMLRRKLTELLGKSPIKTVRGKGYSLSLDDN